MKVSDTRDIDTLRARIKASLSFAMNGLYKEGAGLGYDSTEVRLEAARLFLDRSIDVALEDHRKSPLRAVERLGRLLKASGGDAAAEASGA